jgi:hypothetical protein
MDRIVGLTAVIPPPEEKKDLKTAIGAVRANQARKDAAKVTDGKEHGFLNRLPKGSQKYGWTQLFYVIGVVVVTFHSRLFRPALAIEAVIFDIDGTIVDSVDLHAKAWQRTFAKFGKTFCLRRFAPRSAKEPINCCRCISLNRSSNGSAKRWKFIAGNCLRESIFRR